jgi:hypothetical protein
LRWANFYDNRDIAVKDGVSPTVVRNGAVIMQNVLTFYHPDSVPASSNGYISQRNISISQNILDNIKTNFEQEKWQGISIVEDVTLVASSLDRQKAKDRAAVIDDLLALTTSFRDKAWIFTDTFTIERLQADPTLVEIRGDGKGFNITLPVLYSGEGGIFDTVTEFDVSLAVVLA